MIKYIYIYIYIYIYSIWYELIHFSVLLNRAIERMDNTPNILHPRGMEQVESQPHFISYCKLSKVNLDYISELINLNYSFNLLKLVSNSSRWVPSQFYHGVHLKILPTLLEVILTYLFKACHGDGDDKINEHSKLLLMNKAQKKKKKKKRKRTWNSILNNNGNFNIQVN